MDRKLDVVLKQLNKNNYEITNVYDIGANDGRWKYAHSDLFPPHSHFYMFEANPQIQLLNTENQTLVSSHFQYSGHVGSRLENKIEENHLGMERILCAKNHVKNSSLSRKEKKLYTQTHMDTDTQLPEGFP